MLVLALEQVSEWWDKLVLVSVSTGTLVLAQEQVSS